MNFWKTRSFFFVILLIIFVFIIIVSRSNLIFSLRQFICSLFTHFLSLKSPILSYHKIIPRIVFHFLISGFQKITISQFYNLYLLINMHFIRLQKFDLCQSTNCFSPFEKSFLFLHSYTHLSDLLYVSFICNGSETKKKKECKYLFNSHVSILYKLERQDFFLLFFCPSPCYSPVITHVYTFKFDFFSLSSSVLALE